MFNGKNKKCECEQQTMEVKLLNEIISKVEEMKGSETQIGVQKLNYILTTINTIMK